MVTVKNLIELLETNEDLLLHVMLPSGVFVPEHFHITEVGRVNKKFIDCGGVCRELTSCSLQVWTAHDVDHKLTSGKLAKIMKMSQKVLGDEDLPLEVEYGVDVISNYVVKDIEKVAKGLLFVLAAKHTDCLAPDKCGISQCKQGSGCC